MLRCIWPALRSTFAQTRAGCVLLRSRPPRALPNAVIPCGISVPFIPPEKKQHCNGSGTSDHREIGSAEDPTSGKLSYSVIELLSYWTSIPASSVLNSAVTQSPNSSIESGPMVRWRDDPMVRLFDLPDLPMFRWSDVPMIRWRDSSGGEPHCRQLLRHGSQRARGSIDGEQRDGP